MKDEQLFKVYRAGSSANRLFSESEVRQFLEAAGLPEDSPEHEIVLAGATLHIDGADMQFVLSDPETLPATIDKTDLTESLHPDKREPSMTDREKARVIDTLLRCSRRFGLRLVYFAGEAETQRHASLLAEFLEIKDEAVAKQLFRDVYSYALDLRPHTGIPPSFRELFEGFYGQSGDGQFAFIGADSDTVAHHAQEFVNAIVFASQVLPVSHQQELLWRLRDFLRNKPGINRALLEAVLSAVDSPVMTEISQWSILKRWIWNRWFAPPKQPPQLQY